MIEKKDIARIGKFQKTHALKGELNAILEVDPEFAGEGNALIVDIEGIYVPFFAESIRAKGSTSFLVKLEGIDNEGDAGKFVNREIYAVKSELAPFYGMEEDEMKDGDELEGYSVTTRNEGIVGIVESVDTSTQNTLFVVKTPSGETVYIPAAPEWIVEVDDEGKTIEMELPEGLLDLNQKKHAN